MWERGVCLPCLVFFYLTPLFGCLLRSFQLPFNRQKLSIINCSCNSQTRKAIYLLLWNYKLQSFFKKQVFFLFSCGHWLFSNWLLAMFITSQCFWNLSSYFRKYVQGFFFRIFWDSFLIALLNGRRRDEMKRYFLVCSILYFSHY